MQLNLVVTQGFWRLIGAADKPLSIITRIGLGHACNSSGTILVFKEIDSVYCKDECYIHSPSFRELMLAPGLGSSRFHRL